MTEEIVLEVKGIEKSFSGTKVLKGVNFSLRKGEIHALVGENGAGKSTLMNIIGGVLSPDAGEIYIDGNRVEIQNTHQAQMLGIGFVHQEIALCPDISVAENIFMWAINNSKKLTVDYKELYRNAVKILEPLAKVEVNKKVGELSISKQQIVEIAKAISMKCKVLILDEPTAALSEAEAKALFKIMRELKSQGIGIIYISHRMAEIFNECDRITILRDGCYVGTYDVTEVDPGMVVNKMVGREIGDMYPPKKSRKNEESELLLEVKDFSDYTRFKNISFKLYKGEVVGIFGLIGAGRSEVAQAICGLRSYKNGELFYKGKKIRINSGRDAINEGIVYLTEDRKIEGLFLEMSIKENIVAMKVEQVSKKGFVSKRLEDEQGDKFIKLMNIKCKGVNQKVISLSGGNQQKVLISKLLMVKPKVIFLDEPTRGIDVGAKSEIHKLIRQLANEGIGIVMISSELPEIVGMCDRVIVMHEGTQCGEVTGRDINEEKIIHLASGIL